jgi:hypothetical protein
MRQTLFKFANACAFVWASSRVTVSARAKMAGWFFGARPASLISTTRSNEELYVGFYWRDRQDAIHPGEEGLIHWKP